MAGFNLKSPAGGLDNISVVGKVAIGAVFVVLMGAGYFMLFYSDIESAISASQDLLVQKKRELEQHRETDKAYNKDITELERRKQLSRRQKKILPDDSESPAFLSSIQTVATISGVKLTSWVPQDEVPGDFYAKVPMELQLQGKYHQVAKFFNGIGQVDRIINMENISIKVKTDGSKAKAKASRKKVQLSAGEDTVVVEVKCLATAFRALRTSEGRNAGKKKKGRRRSRGKKK